MGSFWNRFAYCNHWHLRSYPYWDGWSCCNHEVIQETTWSWPAQRSLSKGSHQVNFNAEPFQLPKKRKKKKVASGGESAICQAPASRGAHHQWPSTVSRPTSFHHYRPDWVWLTSGVGTTRRISTPHNDMNTKDFLFYNAMGLWRSGSRTKIERYREEWRKKKREWTFGLVANKTKGHITGNGGGREGWEGEIRDAGVPT